jgi:hypothetical protein
MPYYFLDRDALDAGRIEVKDGNDPASAAPGTARMDLGWHVCEADARRKLTDMVSAAVDAETGAAAKVA